MAVHLYSLVLHMSFANGQSIWFYDIAFIILYTGSQGTSQDLRDELCRHTMLSDPGMPLYLRDVCIYLYINRQIKLEILEVLFNKDYDCLVTFSLAHHCPTWDQESFKIKIMVLLFYGNLLLQWTASYCLLLKYELEFNFVYMMWLAYAACLPGTTQVFNVYDEGLVSH